ncbi:hypothetical protein BV25DRAFT_1834814 [Artomyces pyxidatus]|uniref:Uncharacterized protein n=1 Tax=Artomyces pyxidatus TaxID=48021 RepID=A0ACB8THC8_9AGAM|nr:hypothetical protein BV25DRAFT_1834814 [Artomyces pyxidatus]
MSPPPDGSLAAIYPIIAVGASSRKLKPSTLRSPFPKWDLSSGSTQFSAGFSRTVLSALWAAKTAARYSYFLISTALHPLIYEHLSLSLGIAYDLAHLLSLSDRHQLHRLYESLEMGPSTLNINTTIRGAVHLSGELDPSRRLLEGPTVRPVHPTLKVCPARRPFDRARCAGDSGFVNELAQSDAPGPRLTANDSGLIHTCFHISLAWDVSTLRVHKLPAYIYHIMARYSSSIPVARERRVTDTTLSSRFTLDSPFAHKFQIQRSSPPLHRVSKAHDPSKYVAVSAQVVFAGATASIPMVARVSVTDYIGDVVFDTFVRPTQPVVDHRTAETGVLPSHIANAPTFLDVQTQLTLLLRNKIIVGHALWHFFSVMGIRHPTIDTRDVASFIPFRRSLRSGRQLPPLPVLVNRLMGQNIGLGHEHPLENARAALDLFRSAEQAWETAIGSGSWPCTLPPAAYSEFFL